MSTAAAQPKYLHKARAFVEDGVVVAWQWFGWNGHEYQYLELEWVA